MEKIKEIKFTKLEHSLNTYKAYYYDHFYNTTYSVVLENDLIGLLGFNSFIKMIKFVYQVDKVKVVIENKKTIGMAESGLLSGILSDID